MKIMDGACIDFPLKRMLAVRLFRQRLPDI
jgi:hypothetical protein